MVGQTTRIRMLTAVAGQRVSLDRGDVVPVGDGCVFGMEEAGNMVAKGTAEWVEKQKKETATRRAPEREAKATSKKG